MEKILTPDVSQAGLWALAPGELADAGLDDLVWLAAHVCTAPVAYLSYRDAGMRRFRHVVGATIADMPAARFLGALEGTGGDAFFEIPDAQSEPRSDSLSSVCGVAEARSFASVPLIVSGHGVIGQLCVVTTVGRSLERDQRLALSKIGSQIAARLLARWRAAELSLVQQEQARKAQFLESLLANTPAAVISTSREGLISSFNPAAERMLGFQAGEVEGRLNVNALHLDSELVSRLALLAWRGDQQSCVWQAIAGLEPGSDPSLQEWQLRCKDGQALSTLLTVAELRDAEGGVVGYVGTALDITERRRLDQLKAEFISTVSHELRTPLTAISGALGLIRGGACGPMPGPVLPMLEIAHKNSLRLGYLIDDLLDMEQLASGRMRFDMEVQPLLPLVERAIEAIADQARESGVHLVVVARADSELRVRVDADRLQQVIVNFLSNAAKFSPRGAQVEISIDHVGTAARVTVSDHGPGIPEQFRARIFHKFSQADSSDTRQKGGTGLGLAICKELIERMNGLIGYDTLVGAGTRFHFQLPVVQASHDFPSIVGAPLPDAPRVLVVEDDHDIAQLIVLMLNRAQIAADVAGTALQAIESLQQARYAAMTLDLLLPDQSGLVLMRHIRDLPGLIDLPVVVVSAHTEDGRHSLNRELAPIEWIPKPIDEHRLIRAVRRALEHRTPN